MSQINKIVIETVDLINEHPTSSEAGSGNLSLTSPDTVVTHTDAPSSQKATFVSPLPKGDSAQKDLNTNVSVKTSTIGSGAALTAEMFYEKTTPAFRPIGGEDKIVGADWLTRFISGTSADAVANCHSQGYLDNNAAGAHGPGDRITDFSFPSVLSAGSKNASTDVHVQFSNFYLAEQSNFTTGSDQLMPGDAENKDELAKKMRHVLMGATADEVTSIVNVMHGAGDSHAYHTGLWARFFAFMVTFARVGHAAWPNAPNANDWHHMCPTIGHYSNANEMIPIMASGSNVGADTYTIFNHVRSSGTIPQQVWYILHYIMQPNLAADNQAFGSAPLLCALFRNHHRIIITNYQGVIPGMNVGANTVDWGHVVTAFKYLADLTMDTHGMCAGYMALLEANRMFGPTLTVFRSNVEDRFSNLPAFLVSRMHAFYALFQDWNGQMAANNANIALVNLTLAANADGYVLPVGGRITNAEFRNRFVNYLKFDDIVQRTQGRAAAFAELSTDEVNSLLMYLADNDPVRAGFNAPADIINGVGPAWSPFRHHQATEMVPMRGFDAYLNINSTTGLTRWKKTLISNASSARGLQLTWITSSVNTLHTFYLLSVWMRSHADAAIYGLRMNESILNSTVGIFDTGNVDMDSTLTGYHSQIVTTDEYTAVSLFRGMISNALGTGDITMNAFTNSVYRLPALRISQYAVQMALPPKVAHTFTGSNLTAGGNISHKHSLEVGQQLKNLSKGWSAVDVSGIYTTDLLGLASQTTATAGFKALWGVRISAENVVFHDRVNHDIIFDELSGTHPTTFFARAIHRHEPLCFWIAHPYHEKIRYMGSIESPMPFFDGNARTRGRFGADGVNTFNGSIGSTNLHNSGSVATDRQLSRSVAAVGLAAIGPAAGNPLHNAWITVCNNIHTTSRATTVSYRCIKVIVLGNRDGIRVISDLKTCWSNDITGPSWLGFTSDGSPTFSLPSLLKK